MSLHSRIRRLWSTVIPMPHGPVQMIGYSAAESEGVHLAFLNHNRQPGEGPRPLWVIPATACGCAGRLAANECSEVLTREFQRFTASPGGVVIALYRHPEAFGRLMVGAAVPHTWGRRVPCGGGNTQLEEHCQVRQILDELKIAAVRTIYPPHAGELLPEFHSRVEESVLIHKSLAGDS